MVREDTVDDYRVFEVLEQYLYQPEVLKSQVLCQLPMSQRLQMIEKYYDLDDTGPSSRRRKGLAWFFLPWHGGTLSLVLPCLDWEWCSGQGIDMAAADHQEGQQGSGGHQ